MDPQIMDAKADKPLEFTWSTASVEELCRTGKELLDQRRFAEAEWQFTQAKARAPDSAEVYYCIGLFFADLGRPADALTAFDRAIALDGSHAKAHNNRGSALQHLNRPAEAEAAFRHALELAPDEALPYINLANVIDGQARSGEALKIYDLALSRGVQPELIGHYRSALLGKATSRSPDSWLRSTFDNFAPTFDEHLRGLRYVVPAAMAALLDGRTKPGDRLLDLGCGTGWVGTALAGRGLHIIGVDLSERMLALARERGKYQELHAGEVHAHLRTVPSGSLDVVTAADVLIYIGDVSDLFAEAMRVLRPGGLFTFSIEESSAAEYILQNTGRYAHSRGYVRRLTAFSFASVDEVPGAIRLERGQPLHGRVYLLQRLSKP